MPYFKQIWLESHTVIQLWDITESFNDLTPQIKLNNIEKEQLKKLNNQKRQIEFILVRIMLRKILPEATILYNNAGAPYIEDPTIFISVSHSNRFVCLMHSCFPCGIDVEQISSKALHIAKRFLTKNELKLIRDEFSFKDATLLWSAKESLFKLLKKENVEFAAQLNIVNINPAHSKRIDAEIHTAKTKTKHQVHFDFIDEQVITWILDKNNLCYAHG